MMKKNDIEIKSATIQKFRLRRSDSVYGILPEITVCLDRFGLGGKYAKTLELFGVHTCSIDFLVDLLRIFDAYYPHELAGHSAHIVFFDGKPIGICPLDSDWKEWIICTKKGYQKVAHKRLFKVLLKE